MGRDTKKPVNIRFNQCLRDFKNGGADRDRTCDPHNAIVVLYQLSYDPIRDGDQFSGNTFVVKA